MMHETLIFKSSPLEQIVQLRPCLQNLSIEEKQKKNLKNKFSDNGIWIGDIYCTILFFKQICYMCFRYLLY